MIYGNIVRQYENNNYPVINIDESSMILESLYREQDNYSSLLEYCMDDNEREILEAKYEVITEVVGAAIIAAILAVLAVIGTIIGVAISLFKKGTSNLSNNIQSIKREKKIAVSTEEVKKKILSTNPTKVKVLHCATPGNFKDAIDMTNSTITWMSNSFNSISGNTEITSYDLNNLVNAMQFYNDKKASTEDIIKSPEEYINHDKESYKEKLYNIMNSVNSTGNINFEVAMNIMLNGDNAEKYIQTLSSETNKTINIFQSLHTKNNNLINSVKKFESSDKIDFSKGYAQTYFKLLNCGTKYCKSYLESLIECLKESIKFNNHAISVIKSYINGSNNKEDKK